MRRAVARALAVAFMATGIGVGAHHPAQACYCSQLTLPEAFTSGDAAAVVVGQIVGDMAVEGSYPSTGTLTIELSDVYLSQDLESPVRVRTAGGSSACGFDSLPTELSGFVLVPLESGELWTGSCEGSWTAEEVRLTALGLGIERSGPIGADGNIVASEAATPARGSVADQVERFQTRWWIVPFLLIAVGVLLRRRQREGASNTAGDPADD